MKDALRKLLSVYRKAGFPGFLKKLRAYLRAELFDRLDPLPLFQLRELRGQLRALFEGKAERVILWRSSFGWASPLFQRPQHIARAFAKSGSLVLYEVSSASDGCRTLRRQEDGLWLCNYRNFTMALLLRSALRRTDKPKLLQLYSTDWRLSASQLERWRRRGCAILYEYVDALSPALSGTGTLPKNVTEKYAYAMSHPEVYVSVTAERLRQDVLARRGAERLIMSTNGVDYAFFQVFDPAFRPDADFQRVLDRGLPLLCYYGAMASWVDYALLRRIGASGRYSVVLFGIRYDESLDRELRGVENVFFLGPRDYTVLKEYARRCDVMLIPFLVDPLTRATSPVKLFEYMALRKPIVTTDLDECRRYRSVLIGRSHEDYLEKLEEALRLRDDEAYLALLDREARANDWSEKARAITDALRAGEAEARRQNAKFTAGSRKADF